MACFPVSDQSKAERFRGEYFTAFSSDDKQPVYSYILPIEILPTSDESVLDEIFDRINRNVSRLSPQELRHAKFGGVFASAMDQLAEEIYEVLPQRFPNIAESSRRQMKDVEFTTLLLLLVESGPESTSQERIDEIYADRDDDWEDRRKVLTRFRKVLQYVASVAEAGGPGLQGTRLRNQGDFYALFGAAAELIRKRKPPAASTAAIRLTDFMAEVVDESARSSNREAKKYYDAARSAANDPRQRSARIAILREVMLGS